MKAKNKTAIKPITSIDTEVVTKTKGIVKTHTSSKATAKANIEAVKKTKAKAKAKRDKEKAANMEKKAKEAQAKAKDKAKQKATEAREAQAKQVSMLTPKEIAANTRKELNDAMAKFIQSDLGIKASKSEMDAMKAAFHKGATSVKLVPLSKCAHAIGLALGAIPESDDTVDNLSCRACYPDKWDSIRGIYNKVATAFKKSLASIADGHKQSFALKASVRTSKKGKAVKSGTVSTTAKVIQSRVTDTAVKLTEVLARNAVEVAMVRVNNIGSCVILGKADYLRYVRHFTSRQGKDQTFHVSTPPAWMKGEAKSEWEKRVNEGVERPEVTLTWLQGQARIAAVEKGIKVKA